MAVRKHNGVLQEVWTIQAGDLDAGDTLVVPTDIRIPRDLTMTEANVNRFLAGLADCRAFYQEEVAVGAPNVPPPQITASATGMVVVTLVNTGAPGSASTGELLVVKEHSENL